MPNQAAHPTTMTKMDPPGSGILCAARKLQAIQNAVHRNARNLLTRRVTLVSPLLSCSHFTSTPLTKVNGFTPTQLLQLYSLR
jgi:hypothetical protein